MATERAAISPKGGHSATQTYVYFFVCSQLPVALQKRFDNWNVTSLKSINNLFENSRNLTIFLGKNRIFFYQIIFTKSFLLKLLSFVLGV